MGYAMRLLEIGFLFTGIGLKAGGNKKAKRKKKNGGIFGPLD